MAEFFPSGCHFERHGAVEVGADMFLLRSIFVEIGIPRS